MGGARMLADVQGLHAGLPCLVLGSGPSLNSAPSIPDGYIRIALSSACKHGPYEYFYTADARHTQKDYWGQVQASNRPLFVLRHLEGAPYGYYHKPGLLGVDVNRIIWFDMKPRGVCCTLLPSELLYASTSDLGASQIAFRMGCSRVVLAGCDLRFMNGIAHWDDTEPWPESVASHDLAILANAVKEWKYFLGLATTGPVSSLTPSVLTDLGLVRLEVP